MVKDAIAKVKIMRAGKGRSSVPLLIQLSSHAGSCANWRRKEKPKPDLGWRRKRKAQAV